MRINPVTRRRQQIGLVAGLLLVAAGALASELTSSLRNGHSPQPGVVTGGLPGAEAADAWAAAGVTLVVDLRTAAEGVDAEAAALAARGIRRLHLPVGRETASAATVAAFSAAVGEASVDAPVVLHCASGNRVGDLWARHRVAQGVPLPRALEEARLIGLRVDRESLVVADLADRRRQAPSAEPASVEPASVEPASVEPDADQRRK